GWSKKRDCNGCGRQSCTHGIASPRLVFRRAKHAGSVATIQYKVSMRPAHGTAPLWPAPRQRETGFVLIWSPSPRAEARTMNLDFSTFTWVHVIISLGGIATGFVVMKGMLASQRLDDWTAVFLATTALTSLTGFGFPFTKLLPSHIVGIVSLVVLLIAILARY